MSFRAVLFDLDGTLLDTLEDLAASMNAVLERHGFPTHGTDAYRLFVGDGMENLVRRSLPEGLHGDAETVAECLIDMRAEYGRRWKESTRSYPGIPELLSRLAERGLALVVLSNKPHEITQKAVREFLSRWTFTIVLGERPGIPRKPDPTAAMKMASILNIPPHEFLYLGDTHTDMRTAAAAGMFGVGALWGFRGADELLTSGARAVIQKPLDLLAFLEP